jgi:DNA-binding response OmpR family regulator
MIVVVDDRSLVQEGFKSMFDRLGYPAVGVSEAQLEGWIDALGDDDLDGIEAFLLGNPGEAKAQVTVIKARSKAPLIALLDQSSLPDMLHSFTCGVDDVVRKPVHPTEILARANAIRRRQQPVSPGHEFGRLRVFVDGRDPTIDDVPFPLPRRERRILGYLASIGERRASRTQVYNAVYGVLEDGVEECVVESHISKLRKKLKAKLGCDIIDSKRFLGYRLEKPTLATRSLTATREKSLAQVSAHTVA